jgi:hypothetical protein
LQPAAASRRLHGVPRPSHLVDNADALVIVEVAGSNQAVREAPGADIPVREVRDSDFERNRTCLSSADVHPLEAAQLTQRPFGDDARARTYN